MGFNDFTISLDMKKIQTSMKAAVENIGQLAKA